MIRRVIGLIYIIGGAILLFFPAIKEELFFLLGLGEGTDVYEIELLAYITINFVSYTIVLFLLYKGIKLFRSRKQVC